MKIHLKYNLPFCIFVILVGLWDLYFYWGNIPLMILFIGLIIYWIYTAATLKKRKDKTLFLYERYKRG